MNTFSQPVVINQKSFPPEVALGSPILQKWVTEQQLCQTQVALVLALDGSSPKHKDLLEVERLVAMFNALSNLMKREAVESQQAIRIDNLSSKVTSQELQTDV